MVRGCQQDFSRHPYADMRVSDDDVSKLALKLLEVLSRVAERDSNFRRYWRIMPVLETFSEWAVSRLEQDVSKKLLAALEVRLAFHARSSSHPDAEPARKLLTPTVYVGPRRR